MLGECLYCGDRLTNELRSVSCDHCGEGFHVECARSADEFYLEENTRLLRSTTYDVTCPDCEETWSVGFDPRA